MKKLLMNLLVVLIGGAILFTPLIMAGPVMADNSCVHTSIIGGGTVCDDGSGNSVKHILNLVVNIMTIGVGILGVLGITIVGIQYLTAGGNEEKTRKAKRRMFEIMLGLVAYVLIYAVLYWLIPDFQLFI